jgi:hypothetical protein
VHFHGSIAYIDMLYIKTSQRGCLRRMLALYVKLQNAACGSHDVEEELQAH